MRQVPTPMPLEELPRLCGGWVPAPALPPGTAAWPHHALERGGLTQPPSLCPQGRGFLAQPLGQAQLIICILIFLMPNTTSSREGQAIRGRRGQDSRKTVPRIWCYLTRGHSASPGHYLGGIICRKNGVGILWERF